MNIWKRLRIVLCAGILLGAGVMGAGVGYAAPDTTATTSDTGQTVDTNPIWSGLWEGVNLATGGFNSTSTTNSSTSGSNGSGANPDSGTSAPGSSSTGGITSIAPNEPDMYAALGDSVAAGVGLPNPVSVPADETRCGRTAEAYPYQVARTVGLQLIHAACSGATAGDLFTIQRSGSPNLPPQLDAAFAGGKPQLITITAGANDVHWIQLVSTCYFTNCATFATTATANAALLALQTKLYVLFSDIWLKSGGNPPTTVITGYYDPVSAACATQFNGNITPTEINWITAEVSALNQTIQGVASVFDFVRFAPVSFAGHDVCSGSSWIQGTNDPQPFHPTVTGQQVYARSVLSALGK